MTDLPVLREKILRIVEHSPDDDGAWIQAADLLKEADLSGLPMRRLAILRSFTIEPLIESLQVKCFLEGFCLEFYLSQFNQIVQEIVDTDSGLHQFNPEVVFLATREEESGEGAVSAMSSWVAHIIKFIGARVIISNFLVSPDGRGKAPWLNKELLKLQAKYPEISIFDLDSLASKFGRERFQDPAQMARMSNPYRLSAYPAYADALLSKIRSPRKCLVLDLDNTLWEGIVGEDGVKELRPFADFQQAVLEISRRGILLAVNSKNNPEEAMWMLRSHPGMVLKEEHFSSLKINWRDKAENLREIARELNIGLDSLVFMDDNPAECERARQACSEVLVVQLPAERERYREILEGLGCFTGGGLTEEDRNRTAMYRDQAKRKKMEGECGTLEEYYASLKMKAALWRNNRSQIPRIAQMTQKTNQFNLTTRRCTEAEIGHLMDQGFIYSLQIEDRYGDNGIIAVAVVLPGPDGSEWAIDNLLMSCRVVMRTIEDTLLAEIAADAREAGAKRLIGRYIPTAKNAMVKEFYPQRGFVGQPSSVAGATDYLLDLAGKAQPKPSPWIELTRGAELPR